MSRVNKLWLPVALCLCSCQSFGDLLIFGPGLVKPGAIPSDSLASARPSAEPASLKTQAYPYLEGRVSLDGVPLADALLSVVDPTTGKTLAPSGRADGKGQFRIALADPVSPGAVLLVKAAKGDTQLFAMTQAEEDGGVGGSGYGVRFQPLAIDLATTLVTKKIVLKVLEVAGTDSGTPASRRRLTAVMVQVAGLVRDAVQVLGEVPHDARLWQAILNAEANPTPALIDTLAINAVAYSILRASFADVVDACHQGLLANLQEGGPVIFPSLWQVGYVVIEPPQVRRSGYDTLLVIFMGQTSTYSVSPEDFDTGADRQAVIASLSEGLYNAPPPPPISGGGGAAAPVIPVVQPPFVAFLSNELHANNDIFTVSADGASVVALTNDTQGDSMPTFSPDGSKIAFLSDTALGGNKLCVMNADGTNRQDLVSFGTVDRLAWSPDGTKIAYGSATLNKIGVYDLIASTTMDLPRSGKNPAWSPDGQSIAFSDFSDIYVVKPDGTGEVRVTALPASESNPCWSPDSQWICYECKNDGKIHKVKPDGTGDTPLGSGAPLNNVLVPAWSPDGQFILFQKGQNIGVIQPDGTGEMMLTNAAGTNQRAVWARDSQSIVFTSNRSGQFDLYKMNVDGTDQAPIALRPALDDYPTVR